MKLRTLAALPLALVIATTAFAQKQDSKDAPPEMTAEHKAAMEAWQKAATPGEQHRQLISQFEGTWDAKVTVWMDPSQPPSVDSGRSVNTAIFGGRQLRMDYTGKFMGQPFEGLGFSGYDNVTGKYFSTWTDSMSTGMFVTEGEYDPATKTYTYRGEMADPTQGGAKVPLREVVRVVDNDHHVFEMHETRDGKERKSMQIEYTRAK